MSRILINSSDFVILRLFQDEVINIDKTKRKELLY